MSFATTPTIHVSPTSKQVADNYIDMFKIKYINKSYIKNIFIIFL